jgi:hypothetical protein
VLVSGASKMQSKIKSLSFISVSLFFGMLIYFLFRPPLSWMPKISGWDRTIIDLAWVPLPVSAFIKYHLSDILWALALAETVYIIKKISILLFSLRSFQHS